MICKHTCSIEHENLKILAAKEFEERLEYMVMQTNSGVAERPFLKGSEECPILLRILNLRAEVSSSSNLNQNCRHYILHKRFK